MRVKQSFQNSNDADANMERGGTERKIYKADLLQLSTCRDKGSKVKYRTEMIEDVNMQRRVKQSKLHRIEILQMPICRDVKNKVKYKELKYRRCQYAETKKAK